MCAPDGRWMACAVVVVATQFATAAMSPIASADATSNLRNSIAQARGGACPLRSDPVVERAADAINRTVVTYQTHASDGRQPVDDAGPGLAALGYNTTRSKLLRGFGTSEADAIKGLILEGIAVTEGTPFIADCAYRDYGASLIHQEPYGYYTAAVLAEPHRT